MCTVATKNSVSTYEPSVVSQMFSVFPRMCALAPNRIAPTLFDSRTSSCPTVSPITYISPDERSSDESDD
jgi:hypothetical protein